MIKIKPIFNQSAPKIWDDFARIQGAAVVADYDTDWTDEQHAKAITEYESQWRGKTPNFAFGAYDENDLIGFIRGDVSRSEMRVEGLYVLPEYQNMKIGARLLAAAERAGSLSTNYVSLVSRPLAEPFYQRHGYRVSYSNVYDKTLTRGGFSGVVPVFKLNSKLSRIATELLAPYDIKIQRGAPTFIYMGFDFNPLGIAAIKSDNLRRAQIVLAQSAPANMTSMIERQLMSEIKPFVDR